ncbi:uncharacterized protein LOC132558310 [Ylistrum balloti]|uniref:uncharacterized protein LOC132558310 n=1 Tax=Ylistrum balloti TaxID=509963 RepID=UPI002905CDAC|nr:uncharacterized protein LOC132558310 [Ylistrum balloti]
MNRQRIFMFLTILSAALTPALGKQYSLSESSDWSGVHGSSETCIIANYSDVVNFGIPAGFGDDKSFWVASEHVLSQWIKLTGCFTANALLTNVTKQTFTSVEKCLIFCSGNFGIAGEQCICQDSYVLSSYGCLGWNCSAEDDVFCGDTDKNHGKDCVCDYRLIDISVKKSEMIDDMCVAYNIKSKSLQAHNCSDKLRKLCVDAANNKVYPETNQHKWSDAGRNCYKDNRQFCYSTDFDNGTFNKSNGLYWVAIFRVSLSWNDIPSTSLYCPAVEKRNGSIIHLMRQCTDRLPSLCITEQDIFHHISTTSRTRFNPIVAVIAVIVVVLLVIFISACVVVKLRQRKREGGKIQESRKSSLPMCPNGNDGNRLEVNSGNSDNDIYNVLHEERRYRPNDEEDLYDHAAADNNTYGQFQKSQVTYGESPYDTMAAIRCTAGVYGTNYTTES